MGAIILLLAAIGFLEVLGSYFGRQINGKAPVDWLRQKALDIQTSIGGWLPQNVQSKVPSLIPLVALSP